MTNIRCYLPLLQNWDVKRTKATPEEKEAGETRNGNVYFISAIYTVPGVDPKKKHGKKKAVAANEGAVGSAVGGAVADLKPAAKKKVAKKGRAKKSCPTPTTQNDEGNSEVEMEFKPPASKKAKMATKAA